MADQLASDARTTILNSIRAHLAESALYDHTAEDRTYESAAIGPEDRSSSIAVASSGKNLAFPPVEMFREKLEMVGGHCVVVRDEAEAAGSLSRILAELQTTPLRARRIALSDAPSVSRLVNAAEGEVDEVTTSPNAADLFGYDVGVTAAQAAIAETGTLVLESESERHRLVSLLPPVHIAIVKAEDICLTLGDALRYVRRGGESGMSRTITFITGPSRTADIELTLTIGVHGPKELYVIVCM
jgi:L-lactate dehydrogenase complex protein LldG